ncbi:hypothetical protein COCON_G00028240 [Conger conger]|uniref:PHD-type domain-containing protein n=1 Tax=Conger conger TaxID=82655 RepID=A0A9Q1DYK4_CONCO|nr:hypothetical protein COCON_G00028240 [Conger conger]
MPPNSQYNRQLGNSNSLKQSSYRTQNNYAYQQPPSRTGYEQQSPLQGIPSTQDSLSKYQHFSQPQQNYCLSDISVRSPEQYYQNCSPNASHSPVRSVGRSPSYNPTSSPLMVNSETFLYSQPPITSGASSSSSLREQGLHIPQQSQPSPSVNHQTTSYAGSLKDKFSEKLLSNPSLWSLNALTSQVENISNNVQQLLLSEALIANKKGSKRNNPKQEEDFKGQLHTLEDSSCLDTQDTAPVPEAFSTSPNIQSGLQEGRCPNSSEDQQESSYYYCRQSTSPTQATTNAQHTLDMVPSCVMTSPSDMSSQSEASHRPAQAEGDNLNTILKELRAERSPISISVPASLNQEQNSPADSLGDSAKENFEESAWSEKVEEKEREGKVQLLAECEKQDDVTACKQEEEWAGEEKCLSVLHEISDAPSDNNYPNDKDEKMYQDLVQDYSPSDGDINDASRRRDTGCDAQPETYKSEFPPDLDATGKRVPFVWGDEYISMKDDELELPHVSSRSQLFEGRLSSASKVRLQADEEQHAVLSSQAAEVSKEESLPSSEVINNITWSLESGEFLSPAQEQGSKSPAKPEVQDTDQVTISEKRSDICDITPLTNSVKTVFSVFNEEATPPSQARERIDQCEAVVPEPESPQLPGKSMMHSAPSWADTPPSPKKANYRELGDLCGPYYPEDSIPRKAMSFKYKVESRDERVTVNCSAVQANTLKRGGVKSLTGGSSGNGRPGRPKKTDKVSGETATIRPRFLERYKKLQQSQSYERRVGEEGAAHSRLQDSSGATQKQELEVEAKENWVHEACAVWTSGVFLVAGKLYGLKEAMSAASEMSCSKCQDVGASVSCCSKGCHQKFHYVCAKESGCLLLEESFSLKCTKHKAL